ncbi:MAG: preprotein translocase subunit SecE [Patescibacteria group bacterium]|nr:preprotein translocase subunit SecE [Patescibacteria group bacterium]
MKESKSIRYLRESWYELSKVTWPTKNQAIKITAIVLGFTLVFAAFLGLVDFLFGTGYQFLINLI